VALLRKSTLIIRQSSIDFAFLDFLTRLNWIFAPPRQFRSQDELTNLSTPLSNEYLQSKSDWSITDDASSQTSAGCRELDAIPLKSDWLVL